MIEYRNQEGSCNSNETLKSINIIKNAFEAFISSLYPNAKDITVYPQSPGKSGAAVFFMRAVGEREPLLPIIIKAAVDPSLIKQEEKNYRKHIKNKLPNAPELRLANSHFLAYAYADAKFKNPKTFRDGYFEGSSDLLGGLIRKMVKDLRDWHQDRKSPKTTTNIEKMEFKKDDNPLPLSARFAQLGERPALSR